MPYDFDTPVNRRGTASLKWDVAPDELPMWVADMDFAAAPPIREAMEKRVAHGVFGYSVLPDAWAEAYVDWWGAHHGLAMKKEDLIFCTGVVPAISSAVRKLTTPGENVLIQTPVYNIFFNSILNNGRKVLESPLRYNGMDYTVDWEDLEAGLADPQTTLMILCNPHNPIGKIWDAETLSRIGALCARYGVTVISDEIHCDLTAPGREYLPFASVSDVCRRISVTCMAPTKAFNIAGTQSAAVAVFDPFLRHKMWRGLNTDEVAEPNFLAVDVAVAAFTQGKPWLDDLRVYIEKNKETVRTFLAKELPCLHVVPSEATYLLWLDCHVVTDDSVALAKEIRRTSGLYLSDGAQYGAAGKTFLRMNVACPRATLQEGLERLKKSMTLLLSHKTPSQTGK